MNDISSSGSFESAQLLQLTQPLQKSATRTTLSDVRKESSLNTIGTKENMKRDLDVEYEKILVEEERLREILSTVERHCIVIFAIFFVLFNIFYWVDLLF